jgi:hypothetical protein
MTERQIDWIMDLIDKELETFQWSYGLNRADNRGEVSVDREGERLRLEVWVADNETPDNDEAKPLIVTLPISPYIDPREQIQNLIHGYLCHEADEQMWFGDDRPFYPHA